VTPRRLDTEDRRWWLLAATWVRRRATKRDKAETANARVGNG